MNKKRCWKSLTLGCRFSLLTALACVLFGITTSSAAPMNGLESRYTQPDGTIITIKFFGDEFYARAETMDGYTIVFDPATKTYYFAALSPDGKEFVSTGQEVGKADPVTLGIGKSIKITSESRVAKAKKRFEEQEVFVQQEARWKAVKEAHSKYRDFKRQVKEQEKAGKKGFVIPMGTIFPDSEIPDPPATTSPAASAGGVIVEPPIVLSPPSFNLTGNVVGLTILIDFSDVPGTVVTQAQVDDYCNKPNYTGFSNAGSIYDYFSIQSGGNLRYNNTVTYYVRVPNPKSYYNKTSVDCGTCGRLLLNDALNVLIANGYNFSNLTTKVVSGKNYVRACNVLFAGADSGVWSYGLWPHRSSISAKLVASNTYIYDYQITNIGTTANLTIGTVCHENGHMLLGYPDLYSYDGNAANIGNFSLMASSGSTHPVNIDCYLKEASGWMNVIDLNSTSQQRCTVQVDGNQVYRYLNPAKATEYFMFEVRDNTGYEGVYGGSASSVNPSAGLVAYHVFETGSNPYSSIWTARNPTNSYSKPYELLVVEANQAALNPWYDDPQPDGNDAFKSTGKNYISDNTTPALKFWDGTGRNTASGCIITNISPDGASMTFVVGAGVPGGTPSIVLSRSEIDSFCALGGTAASQTFTICNGQGGTLSYTISDDQSWLSCSPATGTATSEIDTIVVNFSTSGLAAGSYSATITVVDPAASPTTATITVTLTVSAQPVMSVSSTNISVNGLAGMAGPQVPFTIRNTGGGAMTYSLSKTQSWLSLSSTNGSVVGETDTIYASFDATALGFGTYHDTITITSPNASNSPRVIPVTLRVLLLAGSDIAISGNGLIIAPSDMTPTIAQGTDYGIVSGPTEHTFGILNQSGVATLGLTNAPKVTVSSPSGYFTLSQDAAIGSLVPGESTSFKITYNPQAGGVHTGTVSVASTDSALPRYSFALSGISVGMPAVTNYGAGPAEQASATLTGRLTAGGTANLYLCWGTTDGGTSSTGSWEHVVALGSTIQNAVFTNQVTGLLYGISYDCRVYATNASGKAWSNLRSFSAAPPQPRLSTAGLISGTIAGAAINTTTPNPRNGDGNAVTNMGPWRAQSNTGWGDNTTFVYTGQMYFDGTAYFFVESIDDAVWLKIDGTVYINNTTWNDTSSSGLISKPQGWYDFELRLWNGSGGSGYYNLNPGFQYHKGGGTSSADVDNAYPEDPGNASLFRTAYVLPVAANSISNTISDNITATTADLHGSLKADLSVFTVTVFWSTNNNANAAAWLADTAAGSRVAGTYTNSANQLIAVTATNMPPSSAYYFTMRASNESTNMWAASNGSFYKIATPVVSTSTGATAVTKTSATLSGTLSAGGIANAWICWGDNDAGVSSTSAWDHVQFVGIVTQGIVFATTVTGLATNKTYFYRCAVTNAAGADWSDTATSFSGVPSVGNGGSGYKMKISFANYNKTEPLTNFPALVVFSNGMAGTTFDFSTFLSTNGHDLRFTDSTGTTNLNYEIDTWSTAGRSYVWVQVPKLTNNCSIWARWGDASQASQPTYTTNGATWGNGYVGVWHMGQTNAQESTIKKYNGVASGNTNCSGFVGGAQAFGTGNQLTIPTLPFTSNAVSVEAWVQHRTVASTVQNYFRFNSETAVLRQGGNNGELNFYVKNASGFQHVSVPGQIIVGPWYYLAGTFSGSQLAYKNGVQVGSASPGGTLVTAASAFMGSSSEPMDGYIDEVRLSSVARSANWLWASYMTMASNSVFNTMGTSQSLAPIANLAPTALTNASALLNAVLVSPETNYTVTVYWGPTDGGTNAGAWTNSAIVGSWTKVALTNISHAVSDLVPGGVYYYTFCATNSQTTAWAFPSWQFAPVGTNGAIKTTPTVSTWPTTSVLTYGQALSNAVLSGGSASVSGRFNYNAPSTIPSAGIYSAAVTFTPVDTTNYTTVAGAINVTVNKATPTVNTWPTGTSITVGQPLSASTLSGGSASVPGSFSYNAPSTVPPVGVYTAAVTFATSDSTNYVNVSGTVHVTVAAIPTYIVSYDGNGNTSGSAPSSQTKTNNVSLTLATNSGSLARTGYTFAGWNTLANGAGTGYAVGATYTANAAITLYAKWTPNTYTVSYNANSATSGTPPASQTKTNDVNLTLATNSGNLARTGYAFAGWNTTTNGTGADYAVGATYTANASATLYAKWSSLLSPTNLSATALSSTQIKLAWTDNSADETGFLVERSATSGSGFASIGTALGNATNYTDSTVGPGSNYYYRVSATNALANGTPSAEASATTPKLPATVTLSNLSQTYNGTARPVTSTTLPTGLAVTITYNGAALAPTNAGSYAVTGTVVNATYTGSTNATLTVSPKSASTFTIANVGPFTYDGVAKIPEPQVNDGATVLAKNSAYTLAYTANTNAGVATVTVAGINNYSGTQAKNFTISPATLTVTPTSGLSKIFGAADPTLTYNNAGAVAGETAGFSGTLSRATGESIGSYAITQGTLVLAANAAFKVANYTLSFTPGLTFAVTAKSASLLTIAAIAPFTYDGSAKTPEPEVKDGVTVLVKNTHYTLSYANNTAAGTATLTVTGTGNYTGTQNKTFTINKATPTVNPWPTGTVITVGQPLSASTLSGGSASVSGTFSFDAPSTVPPVGVCTAAVTFATTDDVNYAAVNGTGAVIVREAVPLAPTTLTALPSVGQVALSWTPSAGATGYNVKRAATLEGTYSTIASPAGTNFVDSGLSSGTTYYYRVSSLNAGGESDDSGAGSALIPYGLPFVENFEGLSLGSLDGQNGWSAVDTIVQAATAKGNHAASITSSAGYLKHAFEGSHTIVWTDFMLQPVFFESAAPLSDPMGTVNFYFSNNGHPVVYDGTTPVELSAVTITTGTWVRVTIRSDYVARKWNLYVNASLAAANLAFYANEPLVYTRFEVSGAGSTSVALDDLSISLLPPWSPSNKGTVLLFMLE